MELGDFFNEEQKQLKQKIMEELIDVFRNNMESALSADKYTKNIEYTIQFIFDMVGSILVMFNRDILVNIIVGYKQQKIAHKILEDLFSEIKKQVMDNIKNNKVDINIH